MRRDSTTVSSSQRRNEHTGGNQPQAAVTVTRSAGADGAVVVFVDTDFEPDGSDDGPGLRVVVNDEPVYEGVAYQESDGESARYAARTLAADLADLEPTARAGPARVLSGLVWWWRRRTSRRGR